MATGKYHDWITDDGLTLLQGWARDGLTDAQLAHNMGITQSTFYDWKKKYSEISDALKKGREVVDYEVENDLINACHNGNVVAMIFYLKNRRADRWRDKPEDKSKSDNALMKELIELNKAPPPPLDEQEGGPQ